jgi:hypothetical protein
VTGRFFCDDIDSPDRQRGRKTCQTESPSHTSQLSSDALLVSGILLLTVASMAAGDTDTTKVLTGAIVAAAGSAVAYYLASRNTDAAVAAAVAGAPEPTPNLEKMTLGQAQAVISGTPLQLSHPAEMQRDTPIGHQDVPPGAMLAKGAIITVTPSPPRVQAKSGDAE